MKNEVCNETKDWLANQIKWDPMHYFDLILPQNSPFYNYYHLSPPLTK